MGHNFLDNQFILGRLRLQQTIQLRGVLRNQGGGIRDLCVTLLPIFLFFSVSFILGIRIATKKNAPVCKSADKQPLETSVFVFRAKIKKLNFKRPLKKQQKIIENIKL